MTNRDVPVRNKDIPFLARSCLEEYDELVERVNVIKIAKGLGVKVMKNSSFDEDSELRLKASESGMSYYNYDTGQWFMIYDDSPDRSLEEKRFTVAHEIGHIYLKHNEEHLRFMAYIEELKRKHGLHVERQADLFAKHLLKGVNV